MQVIEYSWDAVRLGGLAVQATDDGGAFLVSIDDGEFAHSDVASAANRFGLIPKRLSPVQVFATAFENALNAASSGAGVWSVDYQLHPNPNLYVVSYSAAIWELDFREATVGAGGPRLAAAVGMGDSAPIAVAGGANAYSTRRPYYLLIPSAMCRTGLRADRGPANAATDAPSDGGVYGQISRQQVTVHKSWKQAGEDETVIGLVALGEPGTPVHAHLATDAVPWSYQHAWDHAISYKCAIKVVDDVSESYAEVHEMTAEGLTFDPAFTGADDFAMYSVPYQTRLLGRILA